MAEQTVVVWDLETVPDLAAAARMLDLSAAPEAKVREALGLGFPKHPLHKIVCIGALVASRQSEGWRIDALGAPHIGERTEAKLISDFIEKIGQLLPQLITFNGHSFDLPVLRYRAMVNRVSAGGLQVRQYFHRYTDHALDLCDALGSYMPGAKVKLDEVSKILGLTGKPEGIDGSRVEEMVLAGQIEEVAGRSIPLGRKAGVTAALGIGSGVVVHVTAAALGISALLAASATAFTAVKLLGAAYLVYIGARILLGRWKANRTQKSFVKPSISLPIVFRQGFMTNLLNPKVALFFLAFLPQFIDADAPSKVMAFVFLGLIFDFNGTLWNILVAWISARAASLVRGMDTVHRWIDRAIGTLFIYVGIRLAVIQRG